MSYTLQDYMIKGDFHTHTMVSHHAYSTIAENITSAQQKGLLYLGITDHGPDMEDGARELHFINLKNLPDMVGNLRIVRGAEVNITDYNGRLDLNEKVLGKLDFTLASYHEAVLAPATFEEHTSGWESVVQNPYIDCMGHPGNPNYNFDMEKIIALAAKNGKAMEVNGHSHIARNGSRMNCIRLIELCRKYEVRIMVDSDAHTLWGIGNVKEAVKLLYQQQFPAELMINNSVEKIDAFLQERKRIRAS